MVVKLKLESSDRGIEVVGCNKKVLIERRLSVSNVFTKMIVLKAESAKPTKQQMTLKLRILIKFWAQSIVTHIASSLVSV